MVILFLPYKDRKTKQLAEAADEFKATAVLPYVEGLSELLRRCLQQQGVCAVFKSETSLRSQLARPKNRGFLLQKGKFSFIGA